MIHSHDAPALERTLHLHFSQNRVNQVNERKEFFRVSLDEIEEICKTHCKGEFKLTKVAEAREYNMTRAKLNPPS